MEIIENEKIFLEMLATRFAEADIRIKKANNNSI